MKTLSRLLVVATLAILSGCQSVKEGPAGTPDPGGAREIRAVIPPHPSAPTRQTAPGESNLAHGKPDQRIDRP